MAQRLFELHTVPYTPINCAACRLARARAEAAALQEQLAAAQRALRDERDARAAASERSDLLQAFALRSHAAMAALVRASCAVRM